VKGDSFDATLDATLRLLVFRFFQWRIDEQTNLVERSLSFNALRQLLDPRLKLRSHIIGLAKVHHL
jgi:hypothetical protein